MPFILDERAVQVLRKELERAQLGDNDNATTAIVAAMHSVLLLDRRVQQLERQVEDALQRKE